MECWMKGICKKGQFNNCPSFCIKNAKLTALYEHSLLTENQRQHQELRPDANGVDVAVFRMLKEMENNVEDIIREGRHIYIHSHICGNGKTSWAIRLLQRHFDNIWHLSNLTDSRGLFIHVPRFLIALKESLSKPSAYIDLIKEQIEKADIVVWDEIGTKAATPFEAEQLLSMINERLDCGKSNIYTSNLDGDELRERVGERLYSRICSGSVDVLLCGQDKRSVNA